MTVVRWFGEPWPSAELRAPVCEDDSEHVATPVGRRCVLCGEEIADGDRGTVGVVVHDSAEGPLWSHEPTHVECATRNVLGGAGHLLTGPHRPGQCDADGGLSYRESARLVWDWVQQMGTTNILNANRFPKVQADLQRQLDEARARR